MTIVTKELAHSLLSLREIELVKHLACDKDYRETARAMRMKEQTVRVWTQRIREKLSAKTNARVVAALVRCGVVR